MNINWKKWTGTLLLAGTFLAAAPAAFSQVSIGIQIGAPPPPRVVVTRPPCPEPQYQDQYLWVDGYWYPVSGHYSWHNGYWTRRPYEGAAWVVPHYEGGRYYAGYWNGPRGRVEHDHKWDHDHDRDRDRWHDDDHHDNGKHKGWDKQDRDDHDHR